MSVGVDLKEPQGFKVIQGDLKEWERQQKLRYDEQHPEYLGLVMTDKNRWEYRQVVDKQSQERAVRFGSAKEENPRVSNAKSFSLWSRRKKKMSALSGSSTT